jgi:hypothetical protein
MELMKITHANFTYTANGKPSPNNSQVAFHIAHPDISVMIRPDRPTDPEPHRYRDAKERAVGDAAMKRRLAPGAGNAGSGDYGLGQRRQGCAVAR